MERYFNLSNKVTIITGGCSGLGKAMSLGLAKAGSHIVVGDINLDNVSELKNEINNLKVKVEFLSVKVNVTKKEEVKNLVDTTINKFGKIDILINSAGIGAAPDSLLKIKEEDWDRIINVNLKGTFLTNQLVAREMVKQKSGKIINIASMSGSIVNQGIPGIAPYCASKAGVILLTKSFATALVKYNINVNSISPGYMKTPLTMKGWEKNCSGYKEMMKMTPMGRPGQPEELVGLAIYLASDASSFMTGSNIIIDGGYTTW